MSDHNVAKAIANVAIFLEFSSEEIINEDAAVGAMEQLAADLQSTDTPTRNALSQSLNEIACRYDGEFAEFVAALPEAFGIK